MAPSLNPSVSRELFLAAVAGRLGTVEPWVMDRIAAMVDEEDVGTGERVYAAGSASDHFYFLREGRVRCVCEGKPVEVVSGPAPLGLLDALAERPRSCAAYAMMPLDLVRVPVDSWLELLEDSFELAELAVLRLAKNVADLEERTWSRGRPCPQVPPLEVNAVGRRLDAVERMALLMRTLPVRGAWAQPISDLAKVCEETEVKEGSSFFDGPSERPRVFVIVEGRVRASRTAPHVDWRGGPGEIVAGVAPFARRTTEWAAIAATHVRALTFAVDDWFDLLEENFELVRAELAFLAVRQSTLRAEV